MIGLSAHSNLSDYERGLRLAPLDIVLACERVLHTPSCALRGWHTMALQELADHWLAGQLLQSDD